MLTVNCDWLQLSSIANRIFSCCSKINVLMNTVPNLLIAAVILRLMYSPKWQGKYCFFFFSTRPGSGAAGAADRGARSKSFSENIAFKERPSSASSSPPSAFYHKSLSHQLVSNHVPLYLSFLSRAQSSDVTRVLAASVCVQIFNTRGCTKRSVCTALEKRTSGWFLFQNNNNSPSLSLSLTHSF